MIRDFLKGAATVMAILAVLAVFVLAAIILNAAVDTGGIIGILVMVLVFCVGGGLIAVLEGLQQR